MLPVIVHLENGQALELNCQNLVDFNTPRIPWSPSLAEYIFPGLFRWRFNLIASAMPVTVTVRDPATGAVRQVQIRETFGQLNRMIAKSDPRAIRRIITRIPADP
jgi:hypothetical protein